MIVTGDEYLLKVAFSNIIDNACKYSPDHSVNIKMQNRGNWIEVIFEDNGIGISGEEINKVLEPFYRASNAISLPGTGIGLHIVNQIITLHKGKISLMSTPGKGSSVTVDLPLSV
jgi:signal transduction histidine kinase